MIEAAEERAVRQRWKAMAPTLNERTRRHYAATEALSLGHGGVTAMSKISGLARRTIYRGMEDIRRKKTAGTGRIRRKGGGRKAKTVEDKTLVGDLQALVEPTTRGDPMKHLKWTILSLSVLQKELRKKGHSVSLTVIANLLHAMDYSLQANRKTKEGKQHSDRDGQFRYINAIADDFLESDQPVISIDAKKKELVGNFRNAGRTWCPQGKPEVVNTHDFPSLAIGKAMPFGVYDIAKNLGWVSLGIDHDTATFAINTVRQWWKNLGSKRYPNAARLMITADAGGSNSYRSRLWKVELQKLVDELKLPVTVCHFPPGTSKWNKVEHRLFSFITKSWRGRPLRTYQLILQLIAKTTTKTGLQVFSALDRNSYPTGIKVSNAVLAAVNLSPHDFHGEWNYTIHPTPRRLK